MNKLRGQGKTSINLIAFITLLLTVIGGGFMTGKVVQNNECNLNIQSCENEKITSFQIRNKEKKINRIFSFTENQKNHIILIMFLEVKSFQSS